MTLQEFWTTFARVPDAVTGALVTPIPHQAQREAIAALDARDAETGLRQYPIHFWHWARKVSKDFMLMVAALHHCACDDFEKEPRYVAVAAWDREQTEITRRTGEQLIRRHSWLESRFKIYLDSIVYAETVREPRTGGVYDVEHLIEFLSRDTKGSHGLAISLKIHNELHTDADYSFEEALMPSPSRRSPVTIYASYHGLLSQQRVGIPLFDLLARVKEGDPRIAYNYVGGHGDRAPWVLVPWITSEWVDEQRALLRHAPNRFRRMIENVPAGPDAGLIALDELHDAIDQVLTEALAGEPSIWYVMTVDLGLSNDWAVVMICHVDAKSKAVVDVIRTWRPTAGQPVNFADVEVTIRDLAGRFRCRKIIIDSWQAEFMGQRLKAARLPVEMITFEASRQDRVITLLKSVFAKRQIRFGPHERFLIEQLESVTAVESRRRDLLRFAPSGSGLDAGAHDDLVVALSLALEYLQPYVGAIRLDEMSSGCFVENNRGRDPGCMLWGGSFPGEDSLCRECPGKQSAKRMHAECLSRGGEIQQLRTWLQSGGVEPNSFIRAKQFRRAMEHRGLI